MPLNPSLSVLARQGAMYWITRHRMELLVSFACLGLLGYFCWQGFYGFRSIYYRDTLAKQVAGLTADFNAVANQRKALEARVQMVRPGTMDADLVDELVRRDLNMGKSSDVIVLLRP